MPRFPKIQNPCPKQWDELQGDARTRFCDQCQHQVHNLSESTPAERKRILSQPGRKCIAYRAPAQAPSLWQLLSRLRLLRPLTACATLLIAAITGGCATTKPASNNQTSSPSSGSPDCPPSFPDSLDDGKSIIMGGIPGDDRPLWKRLLNIW